MLIAPPQSDRVTIQRLRIRGDAGLADTFARQLQTESWSVARPDEWVFIRALAVKGDAGLLRQQASQQLGHACLQTVDGDSGGAPLANAVRFRNLPELLAVLVRDLLQGDAAQRWYWLQWRHLLADNSSDAVAQLLREHAQYLPAIAEQMRQRGCLTKCWQALDAAGAESIYRQILLLGAPRPGSIASKLQTTGIERLVRLLSLQTASLRGWRAALASFETSQPQFRLAAATLGLQYFPDLLFDNPRIADAALQRLMHSNSLASVEQAPTERCSAATANSGAILPASDAIRELPQTPFSAAPAAVRRLQSAAMSNSTGGLQSSIEQGCEAAATEPPPRDSDPGESPDGGSAARYSNDMSGSGYLSACEQAEVATPYPAGDCSSATEARREGQFVTAFGGYFYLINVVTRYIDQFSDQRDGLQATQGWQWLHGLASYFAVDLDEPLLRFIADQMGLENHNQLCQWRAPQTCLHLFRQLQLQEPVLWQSDLLRVPATIYYTASHVDCIYCLSHVRLPVRLAGLDINPNWVAWLGRVVSFHYRDSLPVASEQP